MSTKSNNECGRGGARATVVGGGTLASDHRDFDSAPGWSSLISAAMRWLMQRQTGGAGVVLRFERVRPRQSARFQPLKAGEITPQFLDRTIRALKRWKFDIVSMDEVCRRAVTLPRHSRFVCLTFDGGYKDVIDVGLSGAVAARRALHRLCADRVSGRARRSLVAGARRDDRARKSHQPGDRPQGAAFQHPQRVGEVSALSSFSRAGCARCRRRIFRWPSTISASAIRSTSRRCRAARRWTGTIWQGSRPIRW